MFKDICRVSNWGKIKNGTLQSLPACPLCVLKPLSLPHIEESDPEANEFDLGTKIKTPKDLMLEELSLMKNKGSRMFQLRQQRVEKFIVSTENMVRDSHHTTRHAGMELEKKKINMAICFEPSIH